MSTPILNAPQLTIRADADSRIGSGHVMRCLALAQTWRDQGGECVFVGGIEPEVLRRRIVSEGCVINDLFARHPDPGDLLAMRRFAEDQLGQQIALDWLVLDGYHFDTDFQQAMREMGWKVLVIDDMTHLPEYRCDLLLNQNIDAYSRSYKGASDTRFLLGTKYALLRREFRTHFPGNREISQKASNILVTLGGADPDNVTLKVIRALKLLDDNRISARIILGPGNPHRQSLEQELAGAAFAWELFTAGKDMPLFMEWADVAVSAGGSTSYEFVDMGVPFFVVVIADNQERNAAEMDAQGVALNLGWFHGWRVEQEADLCGVQHGGAVTSGTTALHAAMAAIGIGSGDEVIVSAMTFAATANAVVYQGGIPLFADVEVDTLLIDSASVERIISKRTKAIVAVDYAGQPCDYAALGGYCRSAWTQACGGRLSFLGHRV